MEDCDFMNSNAAFVQMDIALWPKGLCPLPNIKTCKLILFKSLGFSMNLIFEIWNSVARISLYFFNLKKEQFMF